MNPIFDTFSSFNERRMETHPSYKLWHRLLWVHDKAEWDKKRLIEPARTEVEVKPSSPQPLAANSGDVSPPPPFTVMVAEFGAGEIPEEIHTARLAPKFEFLEANENEPKRMKLTFAFKKEGSFYARGFWVQPSLIKHLQDELVVSKFNEAALQKLLDEGFKDSNRRQELLMSAPELDGKVENKKGTLEGVIPDEIPLPTRDDFLRHHPLLIIAVYPVEVEE